MNFNFEDLDLNSLFDTNTSKESETKTQEVVNTAGIEEKQPVFSQKKNSAKTNALLQSAQAKMSTIKTEMNNCFVEREKLIDCMLLAITTGTNLLMLGNPGTAKTKITEELCSRIKDGVYFSWMLNKTSDPSEILGSFSIKEMENDKFLRITDGKLPEAHIAFIDEVYKSNAPTLNTLLTIMNEHYFYNDGKKNSVPLISMFGASNEPPEDDSLMALHDRFIFRMNVEYVKEAGNKKRMFANYINDRAGLTGLAAKTTITLDEINELQNATRKVKVPKMLINEFVHLVDKLEKSGIVISDRRQNECFKVIQGSAVLRGSFTASLEDLNSLVYVLWETEDQIPTIESIIAKAANPYDERFTSLKNNFQQVKDNIENTTNPIEKAKKSIESKGAIDKIVAKTNKLIQEASQAGKDCEEFINFRNNMASYNQEIISTNLGVSLSGVNTSDESTK